ncbi:transferase hexapeptide repeat family protein [Streptomyces griseus]|uniref:gamma carbonic anhydrase family protein n=1 Tax=Streptomyces griseus TaxID=1911 RepID=UPI0007C48D99|nr:transferase hexapeptide repeat family protein [Streptomyces griseus]
MPLFAFEGRFPEIAPTAFVHPDSVLTGDVRIGPHCYVGPGASLRGDFGRVVVGEGANIQDNCVLHCFPEREVRVGADGHVGHGAVLHGCRVGRGALVGMNAVVMDDAELGERAVLGAGCMVPASMVIPARHLAVGVPARILRELTPDELGWKARGTATYQELAARCLTGLTAVPPGSGPPGGAGPADGDAGWKHVPLHDHRAESSAAGERTTSAPSDARGRNRG